MNIEFVEVCGFRGFRDKLRFDFGGGFTIITGRNGVGKSTVCDAIEFALTGGIDKYRVEKAAKESMSDYLWWRGNGVPEAHYVSAGFSDDNGEPFTITRTRESGADKSDAEIEDALCATAKPDRALQQLCRTSIIRDEWIAALSLDLTETERFDLVRRALGTVEGPDYGTKARQVVVSTERTLVRVEKRYEEARLELNNALTQLSEAHDAAASAGDVADALVTLDAQIDPQSGDLVERIAAARSALSTGRMRLKGIGEAISEGREIKARRGELDGAAFQERKAAAVLSVKTSKLANVAAQTAVAEARRRLETGQDADALAFSLAALVEHGTELGLDHGHCPLCAAARTDAEFAEGLARARARLERLGTDIAAARRALAETQQTSAESAEQLTEAQAQLAEITAQEDVLRQREAAHIDLFQRYNLDPALAPDPDGLERQAFAERNRLIDLERAILTLEASRAVERITDFEERTASLRANVNDHAGRLSRAQAAVTVAKNVERAVRRTSAEIVDERLALISPLLNELYQRLRPHPDWRSIEYSIRGDVRRFLSLKVGDGLNPQFVFSSGQRRAAGLAFLLSVHLSRSWCRWKTLVLDDPVQHIDDFRALHLVELLAALGHDQRQIICAVEDPSLADLLSRRLVSTSDAPGRRYDLDFGPSEGAVVTAETDIPPMPAAVLRQVSGTKTAG